MSDRQAIQEKWNRLRSGETSIVSPLDPAVVAEVAQRMATAVASGVSVVPISALSKKPLCKWEEFQSRLPTSAELQTWHGCTSFAYVQGKISGGRFTFDFEKFDAFRGWSDLVKKNAPDLADKLCVFKTGGGGIHVVFRTTEPPGPLKLAWEANESESDGREILIEIRGEGNYAIGPGSTHPSGASYELISGDPLRPPEIPSGVAGMLIMLARQFNQVDSKRVSDRAKTAKPVDRHGLNGDVSIIDEFNRRNLPGDVLAKNGYGWVGSRMIRPGAGIESEPGVVFLKGDDGVERSYHHSTNDVLNDNHTHDAFDAYCKLEHRGDISRAVLAAAKSMGIQQIHADKKAGPMSAVESKPTTLKQPSIGETTLADLAADHPRLKPYVIFDFLREGETMNLIGAPKSHKSWLSKYIAISVRMGWPLWATYNCAAGPVLYIDNELHKPTLVDRFKTIIRALKQDPSEILPLISVESLRGCLVDIHDLQRRLMTLKPGTFKLIVIDAAYRTFPDGFEENSNSDMTAFFNTLDQIAGYLNCAILLVHHTSKGNQSAKATTDLGAGAGAQSRAADVHAGFREHDEPGVVVVSMVTRSSPPVAPFCLKWDYPLWDLAADFDPTQLKRDPSRGGRPRKTDPQKPPKPDKKVWTAEEFTSICVTAEPKPTDVITNKAMIAGMSLREAKTLITVSLDTGLIFQHPSSSKNTKTYATKKPEESHEKRQKHRARKN